VQRRHNQENNLGKPGGPSKDRYRGSLTTLTTTKLKGWVLMVPGLTRHSPQTTTTGEMPCDLVCCLPTIPALGDIDRAISCNYSTILVTTQRLNEPTGTPLTSTAGWLAFVTDQHRQPAPRFNLGSTVRVPRPVIANRSSSPLFIVWVLVPANHRRPKSLLVGCLAVPGTVDPGHSLTDSTHSVWPLTSNPNSWAAI
jgi:hypothetical protein